MYESNSKIFLSAGHSKESDGYFNKTLNLSEHSVATSVVNHIHIIDSNNRYELVPDGGLNSKVSFINKNAIKGNDVCIEIHFNSSNEHSGANGIEALIYPGSITGKKLGNCLLKSMCNYLPFNNRGLKERTDLYFLHKTIIPSVIVEVLFLDNNTEASYLLYAYAYDIIARSLDEGIYNFIRQSNIKCIAD